MLLSAARTRVRTFADDRNSELFADSDLDASLASAQYEALLWAVNAGATLFMIEATITTNGSGVADLSSLAPLKIHNVALSSSSFRQTLNPIAPHDISGPYSGTQTLVINYTPRPVFPSSPASAFVWGSSIVSCPPLDLYMCCLAASELKILDNEVLKGLEIRKAEAQKAAMALISHPTWTSMPLRQRCNGTLGLSWTSTTPDSIALCY